MAKVLIVDDEEIIRDSFKSLLRHEGHEVKTAADGMEAIRLLRFENYDVIISDIIMPNLSGAELLSFVTEAKSDIQVILITGAPSVETARAALRDHAFDYLVKPVDAQELRKSVNRAMAVKKIRQEKLRVEEENERIRKNLETLVEERTAELAKANRELLLEIRERAKIQGLLKENLEETVRVLGLAIEKRDPFIAGHQERVADLAVAIGTKMNLLPDRIEMINIAAALHDVGKINVPAEILSKPTALDEEEMAMIRKHARVGYDIVREIRFHGPVAQCVRQHHERWNGTGYPDRLVGEKILLEARVIAVADVVEAMAHHRPYRPALGVPAALESIASHKLILYAPDVVDACHAVFERGFSFAKE